MSSTSALALVAPSRAARPSLYGTRAQLALPAGGVEGHFALASCDRRASVATYALRIDNYADVALRARMYCVRGDERVQGYPLDVAIAPNSRCQTLLPVRLSDVGRYDRASVEVSGDAVTFTLDAPAPTQGTRRFPVMRAAAFACAVSLASAIGAAAATPEIGMVAAPSRAIAGAPLEVPYAFRGWASLRYALTTRDGRQVTAGLLRDHEGTLRFRIPAAAGDALMLSVNVAGPFGAREQTARIVVDGQTPLRHVAATHVNEPPRISEFKIDTPNVYAGGDLELSYATNAQAGDIWLIDESGRLLASAPIDPSGQTSIKLPEIAAGHQLRAVMRARSGSQDAVSSLVLTVLPGAVVSKERSNDQSPRSAHATAPATLAVSTQEAAPGETIVVSVGGAHGDASLVLNDSSGNAIETGDVSGGQTSMTFTAPSRPGTYYVVATVTQGVAQQTLVKTLTVR